MSGEGVDNLAGVKVTPRKRKVRTCAGNVVDGAPVRCGRTMHDVAIDGHSVCQLCIASPCTLTKQCEECILWSEGEMSVFLARDNYKLSRKLLKKRLKRKENTDIPLRHVEADKAEGAGLADPVDAFDSSDSISQRSGSAEKVDISPGGGRRAEAIAKPPSLHQEVSTLKETVSQLVTMFLSQQQQQQVSAPVYYEVVDRTQAGGSQPGLQVPYPPGGYSGGGRCTPARFFDPVEISDSWVLWTRGAFAGFGERRAYCPVLHSRALN